MEDGRCIIRRLVTNIIYASLPNSTCNKLNKLQVQDYKMGDRRDIRQDWLNLLMLLGVVLAVSPILD